jgi:hypothetical protein
MESVTKSVKPNKINPTFDFVRASAFPDNQQRAVAHWVSEDRCSIVTAFMNIGGREA